MQTQSNIEDNKTERQLRHELRLIALQTDCYKSLEDLDKSLEWLKEIKERLLAH